MWRVYLLLLTWVLIAIFWVFVLLMLCAMCFQRHTDRLPPVSVAWYQGEQEQEQSISIPQTSKQQRVIAVESPGGELGVAHMV